MAAAYALILFILVAVSGLVSLAWSIWHGMRYSGLEESEPPWPVALCQSLFPVFLVVFLIRSFVVEPFRIPSESMLPTLLAGDFVLVNKFTYGLRLPLSHKKLSVGDSLQRGDVVVFRYPKNPKLPYIKRVIGLPGDEISYQGKRLYINKQAIPLVANGEDVIATGKPQLLFEDLPDSRHQIILDPMRPSFNVDIVVPEGSYFVLGDNRDYSQDSRYWGFVPDSHIVGKAFLIWFHWKHGIKWGRIGSSIQ
ncbi:MAG: signal peptidase I [Candidatus Porifericomitaceae bacterium WSBS_2022_MAG_OTU9]